MKKLLILLIVLVVAVLMMLTRPDKAAHKEAMMKAVKEYVAEEAEERFGDNVLTDLGKGIVNKTIETALNAKLKMHDYFLFNTTYVRLKGEEQLLSVGLFGQVITFDKKMLREKLEEATKVKEEAETEREAAKQSEKELKRLEKERKKREKELEKERKRHERDSLKEVRRQEKEAEKERKRLEKEAREQEE